MTENMSMYGPQSNANFNIANSIDINADHEVRYWAECLYVSEEMLRRAARAVGNCADAIAAYLQDFEN